MNKPLAEVLMGLKIYGRIINSDGKSLMLATKLIASDPEANASDCAAAIPLNGYTPFPIEMYME